MQLIITSSVSQENTCFPSNSCMGFSSYLRNYVNSPLVLRNFTIAGLSMSKFNACCQSLAWDPLRTLNIQL